MSTFEPIIFVQSSSKAQILSSAVTEIWAVGHSIDTAKEEGNHWCFYLQQIDGMRSVQIDMIRSYIVSSTTIEGGSKANMVISSLMYQSSKELLIVSKLQVRGNLIVKGLVDTLVGSGAHRYEFNREGTGCRAWVSTQLDLLLSRGIIISNKEVTEVKSALTIQAPKGYTYKMENGVYYQGGEVSSATRRLRK